MTTGGRDRNRVGAAGSDNERRQKEGGGEGRRSQKIAKKKRMRGK